MIQSFLSMYLAMPNEIHVTLGKPTTQSNTAHGGQASRAVDGNTNGHWSRGSTTHTRVSINQ